MAKKSQIVETENTETNETSNEVGEQSPEAVVHEGDAVPAHSNLDKKQFKRTKAVAIPLFKMVPNQPEFFKFDGAMYEGKKIDDKKDAAILIPVTDLNTGEQGQIIVGLVLRELIQETYPAETYVGKCFEVTLRKRADKKYNTYDLYEIESA